MPSSRFVFLAVLLLLVASWAVAAPGKPTLTLTDRVPDNGDGVQLNIGRSPDDGIGADSVVKYTVYHLVSASYVQIATITATDSATYTYMATGLTPPCTWHQFAVTASDALNNESAKAEWSIPTKDEVAPRKPTLTLTDRVPDNGDGVQLNIGRSGDDGAGVNDVVKYTIYHLTGGSYVLLTTLKATGAATYTYLATALTPPCTWHQFAVTASDKSGNESAKAEWSIPTKDEKAPGRPTLSLADRTPDNGDGAILTIGRSPDDGIGAKDVAKYTVYHQVGSDYVAIGTFKATGAATYTYTAAGLTPHGGYHGFGVTASDKSGNESLRAVAAIPLKDEKAPGRPTLSLADRVPDNGDGAILTIGRSPDDGIGAQDVTKYTVYHQVGSNYVSIGTVTATGAATYTYTASGLSPHGGYHGFGVSATDRFGNESLKAVGALPLKDEKGPGKPGLTLTDRVPDNGDGVQLNISRSPDDGIGAQDVTKYTVYHKVGANYVNIGTVTATGAATYTYMATGLTPPCTYHQFGVTATDRFGNESLKAEAVIATKDEKGPGKPTLSLTDRANDNGDGVQLNIGRSPDDGAGANDVRKYTVYHKEGTDPYAVYATITATGAVTYTYQASSLTPRVYHGFAVTATDKTGNESAMAEAAITPVDEKAPGAPTLALTDPAGDDGDTLQLNIGRSADDGAGANDVTTYTIYHREGAGAYSVLTTLTATGAATYAYTATGLTRGVLHGFGVTATDSSGNESTKAEASKTPADTTPARPPTNLAVTDVPLDAGTALDITFDASPDDSSTDSEVTSYQVFRGPAAGGPWTNAGSVTATHAASYRFRDGGLTPNVVYWYYVSAIATTGNGNTAPVAGTPKDDRPVGAPSALTAVDHPYDTGKVIDLGWTRSPDDGAGQNHVAKYNIYRRMANVTQDPALIGTVNATGLAAYAWSDTSVPMDLILYEYTVKASTATGTESAPAGPTRAASENNNVVVFQPPTGFTVVDVAGDTGGQLLLTWTRSVSEGDIGPPPPPPVLTGADTVTPQGGYGGQYEFYRRQEGQAYGAAPSLIVSAAGTNNPMTYIDSGLTNNIRYYYKERYRRYNQVSDFTAEVSAIPVNNKATSSASTGSASATAAGLSVSLADAPQTVPVGQDLLLTAQVQAPGASSLYLEYSINGAAASRTAAVTGSGDFAAPIKVKTASLAPGVTIQVRAVVVAGAQSATSQIATITTAAP